MPEPGAERIPYLPSVREVILTSNPASNAKAAERTSPTIPSTAPAWKAASLSTGFWKGTSFTLTPSSAKRFSASATMRGRESASGRIPILSISDFGSAPRAKGRARSARRKNGASLHPLQTYFIDFIDHPPIILR
jgi:hypothetical protein